MKKLMVYLGLLNLVLMSGFCGAQVRDCSHPDQSFDVFFERFVDEIAFQRSRIVFPLVYRSGDYITGDTSVELWDIEKIKSISFPLIRNKKQRKIERVQESVLIKTKRYVEVYHDLPDSDADRVLYKFRNIGSCWYLEEVHDKSQ